MLSINMSDVVNVLSSISSYLIAIVIALVAGIVVATVVAGRMEAPRKQLVSGSLP